MGHFYTNVSNCMSLVVPLYINLIKTLVFIRFTDLMQCMAQMLRQLVNLLCVFSDFINLLDNYEMSTGVAEQVTKEELQENNLFLDAILKTEVMKVPYRIAQWPCFALLLVTSCLNM